MGGGGEGARTKQENTCAVVTSLTVKFGKQIKSQRNKKTGEGKVNGQG